ncbi:peptidoglycan-binding protein [Caenispirillum salinarum]|uniref:peptidoglycan-binding domain-containing protein n=1 Tax=Caenispirillum salinarum TaxID=859058 RepID=UPI00384AC22D
MKKLAIAAALAAGTALSLPALAEGTGMKTDTQSSATGTQMQTETQAQPDMQTRQQGEPGQAAAMQQGGEAAGMSGENLSEDEVRRLQQALKDAGADIEVDGIWGDSTAQALSAYQRDEGLAPSGELDQRTIASLGVDIEVSGSQQAEIPEEKPETGAGDEPVMQSPDTDATGDEPLAQ